MKISAIFDDNVVIVNGLARTVVWSKALPAGWHAVQWDTNAGEIEFSEPRHNEPLLDSGVASLLKALWDAGSVYGIDVPPPPDDVVARARASVLDAFIVQAAQNPDSPQLLKDAAAVIGKGAMDLNIGDATITDAAAVVKI